MRKQTVMAAITGLLLTGCTVDGWIMHQAIEKCQTHQGVNYYNTLTGSGICQDGTHYNVSVIRNTL